ncbi:hypothetical protein LDQ30_002971, partial [Listeria monocytogenes]|nr:hypothetical protein [Listeria monocytogenes]
MPDVTNVQEVIVPPRNQLDLELIAIWKQILGIERIGITDSFFEIGGDSISMVKIRTSISKKIGGEIPLQGMLANNTIEKQSNWLSENIADNNVKKIKNYPLIEHDTTNQFKEFPLTEVQFAYLMGREDYFDMSGTSTHVYIEVETKLDLKKLEKSLNYVIKRHSMLRAELLSHDKQHIIKEVPYYEIEKTDGTHWSSNEIQERIIDIRNSMSHKVFDPYNWPLFEYKAIQINESQSILFIGYDMLITDGASLQIIHKDLLENYFGVLKDDESISFSFRDYVIALENFKNDDLYMRDKNYWLEKVNNFPLAPKLPYKTNPSEIKNPHFERKELVLAKEKYQCFKKIAANKNASSTSVLYSLFVELLSRWSNQKYFGINCTIFKRLPFNEEVDKIVGDFTSTMILPAQCEETFSKTLFTNQNIMMDGLEHLHFDGIEFLRELKNENQSQSLMPIVFTSMVVNSITDSNLDLGNVRTAVSQTSQVYLDYQVMESDGDLIISWDYVRELFDSNIISNMFLEYTQLIDNFISEVEKKGMLNLVLPKISEAKETPIFKNLTSRLYEQVVETPEAIAVKHNGVKYTYDMLNHYSNQVAHYLL